MSGTGSRRGRRGDRRWRQHDLAAGRRGVLPARPAGERAVCARAVAGCARRNSRRWPAGARRLALPAAHARLQPVRPARPGAGRALPAPRARGSKQPHPAYAARMPSASASCQHPRSSALPRQPTATASAATPTVSSTAPSHNGFRGGAAADVRPRGPMSWSAAIPARPSAQISAIPHR
jgi:hypothetical protein